MNDPDLIEYVVCKVVTQTTNYIVPATSEADARRRFEADDAGRFAFAYINSHVREEIHSIYEIGEGG